MIDDGLTLVESLAILEYLEAKYPVVSLMSHDVNTIAVTRMICMICLTDLQPSTLPPTKQLVGLTVEPHALQTAQQRIVQILQFFESLNYFTENHFTLADIVAGTLIPSVAMFGISMESFPKLTAWLEQVSSRESFQQTAPSPEQIQAALPNIKRIFEMR